MATSEITKKSVDALVADGATKFLWDNKVAGFGVRMTANGVKSYVYQYRMGGREATKKRKTIGRHGSPWTPETARAQAKRLALLVGQGKDPALVEKELRRQAVDLAFSSYVETFSTSYLEKRWKDAQLGKGLLEREAVPVLKATPLPLVRRSDISEVLDRLDDRPASAKVMHATLRKLFRWAVGRGDIERSPMEGMPAPAGVAARDRVLSNEELVLVWNATGSLGRPFDGIVRVLMLTGQRREEVGALGWAEVDRTAKLWTLPAERAKNGKPHLIPLSDAVVAELDKIADGVKWPAKGLVFTTNGATAPSGFSKAKARLDKLVGDALRQQAIDTGTDPDDGKIAPWRLHDLRRTFATGMQRLGIRFEVTEAILNHVSGARSGVAGVYQRHDWKEEKRTALDAWAIDLERVVHNGKLSAGGQELNVISLSRRDAA